HERTIRAAASERLLLLDRLKRRVLVEAVDQLATIGQGDPRQAADWRAVLRGKELDRDRVSRRDRIAIPADAGERRGAAALHAPCRHPSSIVFRLERQDAMRILPGKLLHDRAFQRRGLRLVRSGRMMRQRHDARGEYTDQKRGEEQPPRHGRDPAYFATLPVIVLPGPPRPRRARMPDAALRTGSEMRPPRRAGRCCTA